MRLSKTMLAVMVNPFCAPLGEDGRAMALVNHDPGEQMGRDYVGARVLPVPAPVSKARTGNPFGPSVKVAVSYRLAPENVPHTPHYLGQIKSGETFAANAETARLAGVAFVPPAVALEHAALRAARSFDGSVVDVWTKQGLGALVPQVGGVEIQDMANQFRSLDVAADKEGDA